MKEQMNIVIAGHVDHGKSTIIGRLLADTHSLPEGKLDQVRANCARNSKPFEYAFLLDALKDEQAQGITIDSARVFFKTAMRHYIIIDAPGHIEFLKNMVSGASRAEAGLLVIDAYEGIQENSRRHGYMLSMLGIKQIAILVNKMDLVNYDQSVYDAIVKEYREFLKKIDVEPHCFLPVSGREGDNITSAINQMPWYTGPCLLDVLDGFEKEKPDVKKPFRMPVQDVYKFTNKGDDRRIIAGSVESGSVSIGTQVVFYPSGKKSKIKSIEGFNEAAQDSVAVGKATGVTLEEQIYVTRGDMMTKSGEPAPHVSKRLSVNLFWMGKEPLVKNRDYFLKVGTVKVRCQLENISRLINASDLNSIESDRVNRHDVAECTLQLNKAIAFDSVDNLASTSRFVIVDDYEIAGGGIIKEALDDKLSWVRDKVMLRNYKWEMSMITEDQRAEKYNQKSRLMIITGPKGAGKKEVAKALESTLFADGKLVYFLGIGNVLYGVDADIKQEDNTNNRQEHLRRLAEVAHILTDTGLILIMTAINLTQDDLEIIKTTVNPEKISVVWVGDDMVTDISFDVKVPGIDDVDESVNRLKTMLQENGIIFKPW